MHFDLFDLRLFVCIAEARTLTGGARAASLSAAAASGRLKSLEDQVGQRLVYRDNRGVELTQSGEKLLRHARIILRQVDHAKSDLSEGSDDSVGHIRIFANTTAVTEFMPQVLSRFMAERPCVTVDLIERPLRDVVRGVVDGTIDVGIVAGCPTPQGLQAIHFSTDQMVLVTPQEHPLAVADSEPISFSKTLPFEFIGLHEGSSLSSFLQEVIHKESAPMVMRIQLRSFEAMCCMIAAGVGIGLLPESAARRYAKSMPLGIRRLSDSWAVRERKLLVRDVDALPACARALVSAVVEFFPRS